MSRSAAALRLVRGRDGEGGSGLAGPGGESVRAGQAVVEELRATGAITFRPTRWGIWMVGTEAHPIGGDHQIVRVAVGPGCAAEIGSVSATVARRGASLGTPSCTAVAVRVGAGGSLVWSPEPGVAAAGADHVSEARVRLAAGARLVWRDEFVLGRVGEGPGTWRSRLRVSVGGRVVLASEVAAGPAAPGWTSRAVLAGARAVSTVVIIDGGFSPRGRKAGRWEGPCTSAIALPLTGPGVQITAWGSDLAGCRAGVEALMW